MNRLYCGLVLFVLLTACTGTQPEPAPTPTLVSEPILFGEVYFDGEICTVEGPGEIQRGIYYFILNDESDENVLVWLNQILEEKTFEDLVAWQVEPGVYTKPPPWITHPNTSHSFDLNAQLHLLDQVGTYAILVGDLYSTKLWFCEPFRVVAVESE